MREEHFHQAVLPVRVPRGNEGFWQIICQLAETKGTFTVADIDGESNVNVKLIQKYIRLLVAGGFVERVRVGELRFVAPTYRLVKTSRLAPRVRRDGSMIPGNAYEQVWTAIRSLRVFTLRELLFAAATPEAKPTYDNTKCYVARLTSAGYLAVAEEKAGNKPQIWRLRPHMNSGPKPPMVKVIRTDAMWDPNVKKFVGQPATAQEASR
jgi:hypothetical protein